MDVTAPQYLIEFEAWDGAAVKKLYVSTCGYLTSPLDTPADTEYVACIKDAGNFSSSFFGPGKTLGQSEVGYGEIVLNNTDGKLNPWITMAFNGRPYTIRRIASHYSPFSTSQIIATGTIQSMDSTSALDSLRMRLYDRRLVLDKELQTNRYAGTTTSGGPTAEGNEDLKDSVKPLVFGKVFNVPATTVNPFDLIYQVSDGPVSGIVAYDGGAPLMPGSDYSTIAALQTATIMPGTYATAKALGLFRLGFTPAFDVTADVVEGSVLFERYPAAIVRRILTRMGLTGTDYDNTSFLALDAAAPAECGIYIDSESTALSIISTVLSSVGGTLLPNNLGVFIAGRIDLPTNSPVLNITEDMYIEDSFSLIANPDTDGGVPIWRATLRYRKVWQTMETSRLAGCVDSLWRTFVGNEWRDVLAEDDDIKDIHLLASEMTVETALAQLSDATAEVARKLTMYGTDRFVVNLDLSLSDADPCLLGETVTVTTEIGPFYTGKNMVIIGRDDNYAGDKVTLTLWG